MFTTVRPMEPTAAERARSLLGVADSLRLTTAGHQAVLIGSHTLEASGGLSLDIPAESRLVHRLAAVSHGPDGRRPAATAEFTDVAPLSTRDRIRAQVTMHGRLEFTGQTGGRPTVGLSFQPVRITLTEPGMPPLTLRTDELAQADPDPLAAIEAGMLLHLAAAHPEAIDRLTRLVEPRLLLGVTRVHPLRLDRFGIVLRFTRVRDHDDVRLPFSEPARDPSHAALLMRALLTQATTCPKLRTPDSPP